MKYKLTLIVIAVLMTSALVFNNSSASATQASSSMDHQWAHEIGDTIWLDGHYFIVWKRMEALHPTDMKEYYYYQVAIEGNEAAGQWIWEGDLSGGMMAPLDGGDPEDPPLPLCKPFNTPPPC